MSIFSDADHIHRVGCCWRNPYHQLRTVYKNIIQNNVLNHFLILELIEFEPNNLNSTTHMFSYSYNDIISDDLISDQLGISLRRHPLPLVGHITSLQKSRHHETNKTQQRSRQSKQFLYTSHALYINWSCWCANENVQFIKNKMLMMRSIASFIHSWRRFIRAYIGNSIYAMRCERSHLTLELVVKLLMWHVVYFSADLHRKPFPYSSLLSAINSGHFKDIRWITWCSIDTILSIHCQCVSYFIFSTMEISYWNL